MEMEALQSENPTTYGSKEHAHDAMIWKLWSSFKGVATIIIEGHFSPVSFAGNFNTVW